MLLADKTVQTHSRGIQNANGFTIAQTSKMFNILSNSLYSDKIMAVIRELSTNAYDAHVAAGNPNPFTVQLPTRTEPTFIVRDYGTGLSQEDMEQLYTTYGASNKNTSNDFVGCLGLGSKSPFAYTKSFTTCSYFNGKKYTYIAAMDESGVPTLNHLCTDDTDQPNGMEISFAVHQYDCSEFASKAKRVFYYFKNRPVLCGAMISHDYIRHNYVLESDNWKVGKFADAGFPSTYNNAGSLVAVMGNIAYPIDVDKIVGKEEQQESDASIAAWNRAFKKTDMKNWTSFLTNILNSGFYLEMRFDIGELEMDPSREGLQYTKDVIKAIRLKTQSIYLELQKDLSEKIKAAPTKLEAYTAYHTLSNVNNGWSAGAVWTDEDGKQHHISAGSDLEYKLSQQAKLYAVNWRRASYKSRKMFYLTDKIHYQTIGGTSSSWDENHNPAKVVFFQCDTKSVQSAYKIAIRFCNLNNCYAYLLINEDDHTVIHKDFDQLVKDVGAENILKVSDYRHLTQSNRKSRGGTGESISNDSIFLVCGKFDSVGEKVDGNLNDAHLLSKIKDTDDLPDTIVYVPITRYASSEGSPSIAAISTYASEVIGDTPVFAIKNAAVSDFEKAGYNMVYFVDFFKQKFDKYLGNMLEEYSKVSKLVEWANNNNEVKVDSKHYWANNGNPVQVFISRFISLFGYDYHKYLSKNKTLVTGLDAMIMAKVVSGANYDEKLVPLADKTLAKMGVGFTSTQICEMVIKIAEIKGLYGTMTKEELSDQNALKETSFDYLPKMKKVLEGMKNVLDTNPILKYNVCVFGLGRDSTSIHSDSNPLQKGHYDKSGDGWFDSINTEQFRVDLGNTLN